MHVENNNFGNANFRQRSFWSCWGGSLCQSTSHLEWVNFAFFHRNKSEISPELSFSRRNSPMFPFCAFAVLHDARISQQTIRWQAVEDLLCHCFTGDINCQQHFCISILSSLIIKSTGKNKPSMQFAVPSCLFRLKFMQAPYSWSKSLDGMFTCQQFSSWLQLLCTQLQVRNLGKTPEKTRDIDDNLVLFSNDFLFLFCLFVLFRRSCSRSLHRHSADGHHHPGGSSCQRLRCLGPFLIS